MYFSLNKLYVEFEDVVCYVRAAGRGEGSEEIYEAVKIIIII